MLSLQVPLFDSSMCISRSSHQADEVYTTMYTKIVILLKTKPQTNVLVYHPKELTNVSGPTHNNFQPTSKSLIIKSDITELRSYLHATFGKQILIISEL